MFYRYVSYTVVLLYLNRVVVSLVQLCSLETPKSPCPIMLGNGKLEENHVANSVPSHVSVETQYMTYVNLPQYGRQLI